MPIDREIKPGSLITRVPEPLRPAAFVARAAVAELERRRRPQRPNYVFESDGLATVHHSPFLADREFNAVYEEMRRGWFSDQDFDVRWRMWILTHAALHGSHISGDFAEFGVYRAGCAYMILSSVDLEDDRHMHLFDTFTGIPDKDLTAEEERVGLAGTHADTSTSYVESRLARWSDSVVLITGDVGQTLQQTETGNLAFVHMDLNASEPTRVALEYAYPRLSPGGMIVFDDYGLTGLEPQRRVVEAYLSDKPEQLIALPTAQALLIKL